MRLSRRSLGIAIVLLACGENEEPIPVSDLPPAVLSAVRARYPNMIVTEAARDQSGGKTMFEVTLQEGTRKIDVLSTADGQLVETEVGRPPSDLPAAVTRSLSAKYPGATYRAVEDVTTSEASAARPSYFEVLLELADGKFVEVEVASDGTILKEEKKARPEP